MDEAERVREKSVARILVGQSLVTDADVERRGMEKREDFILLSVPHPHRSPARFLIHQTKDSLSFSWQSTLMIPCFDTRAKRRWRTTLPTCFDQSTRTFCFLILSFLPSFRFCFKNYHAPFKKQSALCSGLLDCHVVSLNCVWTSLFSVPMILDFTIHLTNFLSA